jgi:multifunctional 2-oxoglutarate metabolism enzyme
VDRALLDEIFATLTAYPEGFTVHPKLARQFETRAKTFASDGTVDWATAEALACGSLVVEGSDVRFSGEDTRRGTFSQRHAALIDYETGKDWIPLQTVAANHDGSGRFMIYDSLLSEYAALGYEYGYSVSNHDALVLWEAQFGDFVNGAQIIIDQFLSSGEDKWDQTGGLVMLLPHGFEGQGPEHSSARIERFLTLCAEDNMQIVNATSAAQYFHVLRRQMKREVRKPLVIFTPKSPLRAVETRSSIDALATGSFEEILDDPSIVDRDAVKKVVFCSGKVAWDLMKERSKRDLAEVAVVRVEQLFPWPDRQLLHLLRSYPNAKQITWAQEEPLNMGPWNFVFANAHQISELGYEISVAARVESGSPATGSKDVHEQELSDLLDDALTVR